MADYYVTYDYVTGRAGRVSDASRLACHKHANRFAERHGVEMPAEGTPTDGPEAPSRVVCNPFVKQLLDGQAT